MRISKEQLRGIVKEVLEEQAMRPGQGTTNITYGIDTDGRQVAYSHLPPEVRKTSGVTEEFRKAAYDVFMEKFPGQKQSFDIQKREGRGEEFSIGVDSFRSKLTGVWPTVALMFKNNDESKAGQLLVDYLGQNASYMGDRITVNLAMLNVRQTDYDMAAQEIRSALDKHVMPVLRMMGSI